MRYIGSKNNVLDFLENTIVDCVGSLSNRVFADLFAGTTVVSKYMKKRNCKIISNDYMAFSYIFQIAWIFNNSPPEFKNLRKVGLNGYENVLEYLNSFNCIEGFFYKEYSKQGSKKYSHYQRNYFSEKNAKKIDSILDCLQQWKKNNLVDFIEECVLRTSLIDAVTKISNISGTYGAFLKKDDNRKYKELYLEPIEFISSDYKNESYNCDIFDIINKIQGEILYLDPPYNSRQYPPYYHILETISLDDTPQIYGKTGRRPYKDKLSPLCIKNKALESLVFIIKKANFEHIFLSYSTEGLVPLKILFEALSKIGKTELFQKKYRRYKSNSNGNQLSQLREVIFYVKK